MHKKTKFQDLLVFASTSALNNKLNAVYKKHSLFSQGVTPSTTFASEQHNIAEASTNHGNVIVLVRASKGSLSCNCRDMLFASVCYGYTMIMYRLSAL